MNKKISALLLLLMPLLFLVPGCSTHQEDGFTLPEGIKDVNSSIRLTPFEEEFNMRIGTSILAENVSDHELIYFSADSDVQLYYLQGREWLPVKNNVINYPSGDSYLRPPKDGVPQWLTVGIKPLLPDDDKKVKIRVLVIATVMENNQATDEKVAAYIDLWAKTQQ